MKCPQSSKLSISAHAKIHRSRSTYPPSIPLCKNFRMHARSNHRKTFKNEISTPVFPVRFESLMPPSSFISHDHVCMCKQKINPAALQACQAQKRRMYADRGYVEVFKSHHVGRERDVVLRRLRGRSRLLFFRRPCKEVGLAVMAGLVGWGWKEFRFKDGNQCATGRNEVSKVRG
jgi:hypothetical protein